MNRENNRNGGGSSFSSIFITLITGISIGFIAGILFAPKAGKETRQDIADKSGELVEKGREYMETGKVKLAEIKGMGEEFIQKSREKIEEASRNLAAKAGETKKKVDKVIEKGKNKAKKVEETLPLDLTSFGASLLYLQLQIALSKYLSLIEQWGKQLKLPQNERVEYQGSKPDDEQVGNILGTYQAFCDETSKILKEVHDIVQELATDDDKPKIISKPDW